MSFLKVVNEEWRLILKDSFSTKFRVGYSTLLKVAKILAMLGKRIICVTLSVSRISNCPNNSFRLSARRCHEKYILYNTVLSEQKLEDKRQALKNIHLKSKKSNVENSLPIILKYLNNTNSMKLENDSKQSENVGIKDSGKEETVQFPLQVNTGVEEFSNTLHETPKNMQEVIHCRNELLKEQKEWMLNYDNFDDTLLNEETLVLDGNINYGTPDPQTRISKIPCGGCGAHLHCKDPSIPGYLPSEIFKNCERNGAADLTAVICQRCYFLKHHNIALDVQVTAEDYPKVLQAISSKEHAIIVLIVDLTDFPCSIWPGIADIFYKKPIIVVGNKVDLLPKDSPGYLQHIKNKLIEYVKAFGFGTTRLIDVLLVSATTGYGIEKLITQLYHSWRFKGDVYLVGSTNVGKSSIFNALLQSDYCKSQAEDLIQRATTSIWPGTTLNLLKFPIAKPSGHKLELRKRRLRQLERLERHESALNEERLMKTKDWKYSVLVGRIDRSVSRFDEESANSFAVNPSATAPGRIQLGVNMKDPMYALSRWCYDTPGVVHSDHIVHLLTSEELFLTVPKVLIFPKTFILKPGESLFIAGLARLDLLEGDNFIRLTVFCSRELPISVCKSEQAQQFYEKYLGTEYLKVPSGGPQRLSKWPGLTEAKTFTVDGITSEFSAKDVVLSNAGWIALTGGRDETFKLKAWTPEKRGVHLRDCLLPQAVNQRGPRMRSYPTYYLHQYYQENNN